MKSRQRVFRVFALAAFAGSMTLAGGHVALGSAKAEAETTKAPAVVPGQPIEIAKLAITMTPPAGWEVVTDRAGLSVVMQEPKPQFSGDYSKPIFQRNITVAAIHRPSPIDEKRAQALKDELTSTFGKDAAVTEFKVVEHRFFNYRGTNDGLVVYTSMKLRNFAMMQMHVLVSGAERQFLMTYTDLADQFQQQGSGFETAWNSMMSMTVTGVPPGRYEHLIRYGAIAGGIFLALFLLTFARSRRAKSDLDRASDSLYQDDAKWNVEDGDESIAVTQSGVWALNRTSSRTSTRQGGNASVSEPAIDIWSEAPAAFARSR